MAMEDVTSTAVDGNDSNTTVTTAMDGVAATAMDSDNGNGMPTMTMAMAMDGRMAMEGAMMEVTVTDSEMAM